MLEVDAKVVTAEELVQRVKEVLDGTDRADVDLAGPRPQRVTSEDALAATTLRVQGLQYHLTEIQPPEVATSPGAVGGAKGLSKRAVRKATRWYVEPRWHAQTNFDAEATRYAAESNHAMRRLDDDVSEVRAYSRRVADRTRVLAHHTNDVEVAVSSVQAKIVAARESISEIEEQVRGLEAIYAKRVEFGELRQEVRLLLDRLGAASAAGAELDYVAFEERFRGPSADVKEAQKQYLRFVPGDDVPGPVVDIGCGRGEMLEVLLDGGFDAIGVEPDEGMAAVCLEKALTVVAVDGLRWLREQADGTLKAVFCAQVVEHLFTTEIQRLVTLSLQKLRPGGVLIMETINPRSLHAFANHFLADTSHIRPVHPETLRFICEQAGFSSADLLELSRHPRADLPADIPNGSTRDTLAALVESVFGYQDYAIIANK